MNIHTQSSSEIELLECLQQVAVRAPRLPILYDVKGGRLTPDEAIEQIEKGTIDPRVFEKLRTKYSANMSLAA